MGAAHHAELLFDSDVTEDEEEHVAAVFTGFGYQIHSRRRRTHRGPDDLGWLVLAALPLQAFLSALGAEAVKDVYAGVKKLARRVPKAGTKATDGRIPLVLQDLQSNLRIVLEDDLPAEAYRKLITLDLTAYKIGPLHYDRHRRAWRSELDEAAG
ncbi:hypothetical protein [Actinophytocola sp.]|uniref:hypothetical protein n=1 Tax=Actinophytocola sp. TaxID=1872138 RepID=UPI002ED25FF4